MVRASVGMALIGVGTVSMHSLAADTVHTRSGRVYRNVKSVKRGEYLLLVFSNGAALPLRRSDVARIQIRRVRWPRTISKARLNRIIEKAVRTQVERRLRREVSKEMEARRRQELAGRRRINSRRSRALRKSALLPGSGQLELGRKKSGYMFAGGVSLAALLYLKERADFHKAQEAYRDVAPLALALGGQPGLLAGLVTIEERRRELWDAQHRTNRMVGVISVLWIANLLDVYLWKRWRPRTGKSAWTGSPGLVALEGHRRHWRFAFRITF